MSLSEEPRKQSGLPQCCVITPSGLRCKFRVRQHGEERCGVHRRKVSGPTTPEGIASCRRAALKDGFRSAPYIRLQNAIAAHHRDCIAALKRLTKAGALVTTTMETIMAVASVIAESRTRVSKEKP